MIMLTLLLFTCSRERFNKIESSLSITINVITPSIDYYCNVLTLISIPFGDERSVKKREGLVKNSSGICKVCRYPSLLGQTTDLIKECLSQKVECTLWDKHIHLCGKQDTRGAG